MNEEVKAALLLCHRLRNGAARMTKQQFRDCLKRAIDADADYSDNVRVQFQNNPAAFLAHRNPQSQSEELLAVLLDITKDDLTAEELSVQEHRKQIGDPRL